MVAPTVDELTQDLEDSQADMLPDQKSGDRLTLHYIMNRVWAAELNKCYQELEDGLTNIDVLKASGTALDAIVAHVLISGRLPGDYATGHLVFSTAYPATEGIVIPSGTKCYAILQDGTKIYYVTTEAGTIAIGGSSTAIAARATERGVAGNIAAYKILQMTSRITGIVAVENQLEFSGGTAEETDDALRERYFDAIQAPGKATVSMLERALNDVTTISEVRVLNYGSGDIGLLLDHSGGIGEVSEDIISAIEANIAAGTQARGCLAATVDASSAVVLNDDVYGGQVWIRPRCFVAAEDTFSLTYLDMDGQTQTANVTIPTATHRGDMILAEMAGPESVFEHGHTDFVLEGMTFDGNRAKQKAWLKDGAGCVLMRGERNHGLYQNLEFQNSYGTGLYLGNNGGGSEDLAAIYNITAKNCAEAGVMLDTCSNSIVEDCYFEKCGTGLHLHGNSDNLSRRADYIRAQGIRCEDAPITIWCVNDVALRNVQMDVTGCSKSYGLLVHSCQGVQIESSFFKSSRRKPNSYGGASYIDAGADGPTDVQLVNCFLDGYYGLHVLGSAHAIMRGGALNAANACAYLRDLGPVTAKVDLEGVALLAGQRHVEAAPGAEARLRYCYFEKNPRLSGTVENLCPAH